jgi:hypothetical protein
VSSARRSAERAFDLQIRAWAGLGARASEGQLLVADDEASDGVAATVTARVGGRALRRR